MNYILKHYFCFFKIVQNGYRLITVSIPLESGGRAIQR